MRAIEHLKATMGPDEETKADETEATEVEPIEDMDDLFQSIMQSKLIRKTETSDN